MRRAVEEIDRGAPASPWGRLRAAVRRLGPARYAALVTGAFVVANGVGYALGGVRPRLSELSPLALLGFAAAWGVGGFLLAAASWAVGEAADRKAAARRPARHGK